MVLIFRQLEGDSQNRRRTPGSGIATGTMRVLGWAATAVIGAAAVGLVVTKIESMQ